MKRILIFLAFIIAVAGVSCKKYLDKAYLNPNLPTVSNPEPVLLSVINNMHRGIAFDARATGTFVQYFARTTAQDPWERHGYIPGNDQGGEIWRMHYWSFGINLLDMIKNGQAQGKNDYVAVAYTLLAWGWLNLADHHGDVILKEAFDRGKLQFNYDPQEDVYPHVIKLIDTALNYYSIAEGGGASTLAAGDVYLYQGNVTKWKKFAYGVKALAFHRYFLKGDYKADSVISNIDKSFSSVADDALVRFNPAPTDVTGNSFFGPLRNNFGTFRAGAYIVNLLNGNILSFYAPPDPRLKFLFKPSNDGIYRGLPQNQGDFTATAQRPPSFWGVVSQYSAPAGGTDSGARYIYKNSAPFPIMTYSMLQFTKAEAAHKKGDLATALEAYRNGVNGSFDMLTTYFTGYQNFTAAEKNTYVNGVTPALPTDLTTKLIMQQKYISLYGWGAQETWVDMRRYGYDTVNIYSGYTIPSGTGLYPDNAGNLVYRVRPRYNSEYLWNIPSLKAIGAMDPDYHTKPVWFSKP